MIRLKSTQDLIYIKEAIKIGESILDKAENLIFPGRNTLDLDCLLTWEIEKGGAKSSFYNYNGFPGHVCISINEEIIHGIGVIDRTLEDGDIVKIDIGINYKGYFSDQARTYIVGEIKNPEHYKLISACKKALEMAVEVAKEGNNLEHIAEKIENTALKYNLGILKGFGGHGIGFDVHEEPYVSNQLFDSGDVILSKGMVIAIEPMFILGDGTYTKSNNGWTIIADGIGSHFEKTIIIE
jgi:methionyl aminopeptidase